MADKLSKVCDNCEHEQGVASLDELPDGWWTGTVPVLDGGLVVGANAKLTFTRQVLCDGCTGAVAGALHRRGKGATATARRGATTPLCPHAQPAGLCFECI
jgi:hypothetical protein